tara:strand:+ start:1297 stop:1668 length:372 start_codon:yes stop_codon:yes gene_type:complete
MAVIRLDAGPAKDTNAIPICGDTFLIPYTFTGTGFPQPKPANKKSSEPNGSRWLLGFRVSRPSDLAVESPSLFEAKAWENSWIETAATIDSKTKVSDTKAEMGSLVKEFRYWKIILSKEEGAV